MLNIKQSLSFDDILLIPKYSEIKSRSEVDLSVTLTKGFKFALPFVPSNMKTITELSMARLMYDNKSLAIMHRFVEFEQQLKWLDEVKTWGEDATNFVGFSIGIKNQDYVNVDKLIKKGAKIICIDVAHGDSQYCLKMITYVANNYPNILLIAGNTATAEGAERIWTAGADICKSGIGQGSICLTRINTGNGVPSITSLHDCFMIKSKVEQQLNRKLFIMQDGGAKHIGDFVKGLCFADIFMTGNFFSGTNEAPGDIIEHNGIQYKSYVGSSTHRGNHTEGVEALKKYKGPASKVIQDVSEGLKSGLSYQNARNLQQLKQNPQFVKISSAGLRESHAHDLDIILK